MATIVVARTLPALGASVMDRHDLTDKEKQVVGELTKGKTNREIAQALGVSVATVKRRITAVMIKWNCDNRTQVAIEALILPHFPDT